MASRKKGYPVVGEEKNEILRQTVRAIRDKDFDGNLTATAKALDLTTMSLSHLVNNGRGAGAKTIDALSLYLRRSLDQILAANGDLEALRKEPAQTGAAVRSVRFGELPNWTALVAAAQQEKPTLAPWVWEKLAQADVWVEGPVTPSMVADLAAIVNRHFAPPAS